MMSASTAFQKPSWANAIVNSQPANHSIPAVGVESTMGFGRRATSVSRVGWGKTAVSALMH